MEEEPMHEDDFLGHVFKVQILSEFHLALGQDHEDVVEALRVIVADLEQRLTIDDRLRQRI